jgi:hypothetical protein
LEYLIQNNDFFSEYADEQTERERERERETDRHTHSMDGDLIFIPFFKTETSLT